MGPSARSGYLCTAPDWPSDETARSARKVQCEDTLVSHEET